MIPANMLQKGIRFEIQRFRKPGNIHELKRTHIAFTGAPRRHPYDQSKIVLVSDPFSAQAFCYEFHISDISCAEELPALVSPEGDAASISRIWIRKGAIGIRTTPFIVEDTSGAFS